MIVCVCHRVSDKTIARCAQQGAGFDDLQLEHGVSPTAHREAETAKAHRG